MDKAAVVKARLDRNIRKLSTYTTRPFFTDYNVVASMFGDHVLTFDKKYFQTVQNNNDCSYLLAHDFSEGQFTVKTVGKSIVAKTSDMAVTISRKGEIKAIVGDKVYKSLPVESKSGNCIRKESSVICHFVSNSFKIVVDLENEITTLSVSGWYFGKTQGIFGTYNRESYDDWKLPNGDVTNDVYKFMNSYELSGKRKCQLKAPVTKTKKCKEFPSRQCFKFFSQATSPFVKYFDASELEPFWQACIHDTTPCNKKVHYNDFCKSVTAFVASARAAGKWIDFPSKCSSYNNIKAGSEFTQKPLKKALDVVVLVSQQEAQQKYTRKFNAFLQTLHRMLKNKKKMNIKYSVVGFGGVGVAEEAHVKSIGKDVFMNMQQASKVLRTLDYNGKEAQSNDGFMAITEAASLPFRAGSSKLFVLFNTEEHRAHTFGATLDEARYVLSKEVEGTLIVFSDVDFKQKRVFGQSTRHLYTNKKTITGKFDFPSTDYKQIIEDTQGGLFTKDFVNPITVAKASYEIVSQKIRENAEHCKLCRVVTSPIDGTAKAICRSIKDMKCTKKITTYKGTLNGFFFE